MQYQHIRRITVYTAPSVAGTVIPEPELIMYTYDSSPVYIPFAWIATLTVTND